MADHVLERRLWLPHPRERVFDFFADPANIALVNPPSARLRLARAAAAAPVGGRVPRLLGAGARRARARWRVFVREFDAPYRFVDVQLWGPFSRWEHRHRFLEERDRRAAPWARSSRTGHLPVCRSPRSAASPITSASDRQITNLFNYREHRLQEIFGATAPST